MAKLIAEHTLKRNKKFLKPGTEFDAEKGEAEALIEAGAASKKMRAVEDADEGTGDPATDTSLPASGATQAPDPDAVGAAAKTAKRP